MKNAIAFAMLFFTATPVWAYTGNDVLRYCPNLYSKEEDLPLEGSYGGYWCLGYVSGLGEMADVLQHYTGRKGYCIPGDGLPADQAVRVFLKWLREHPARLHETARSLFLSAFHDVFPCE